MKIIVDEEICQHHGQCVYVAPDLFWFDGGEELKYYPEPGPAQRDAACEAAEMCPEQAITLED